MHLDREGKLLAFNSPTVLNVERNSWDVPERFEMGRSRSMTEQIHRQRQDVWGLPYVAVRRKGGQCNSDWRARDMILRHHGTMEPRRHAEPRCQPESTQSKPLSGRARLTDGSAQISLARYQSHLAFRHLTACHGGGRRSAVARLTVDHMFVAWTLGVVVPYTENALAVAEV